VKQHCAVVVVGGGPAGSICARGLARLGLSVVLIERMAASRERWGEVCGPGVHRALARSSLELPIGLGRPIRHFLSSWGHAELDLRDFQFWQAGQGLSVPRPALDDWLLAETARAGVTVLNGCRPVRCEARNGGWWLEIRGGDRTVELQAAFIVEATGRNARSLVQSDAARLYVDRLVCLSIMTERHPSLEDAAIVEACAEGWWYAAPTPDGRQVAALFTDADLVTNRAHTDLMLSALHGTNHVRQFVTLQRDAVLRTSNARTSVRNILWRDKWLAIGDAAWFLDPLSGTGIERAIDDGNSAAPAIADALAGDCEALRRHALGRAKEFQEAIATQQRFYASERRWRNEDFWLRRASARTEES